MTYTEEDLDLQLEETGEEPLRDQVIEILRGTLRLDGEVPLEDAVEHITALLPDGDPYSSQVGAVLGTCYEAAEQIPYRHPSMVKLVTIIDLCLKSSRLAREGEDPRDRPQKLGESLYDWWSGTSPADGPARYVNFQTFAAPIEEHGLIKESIFGVGVLEDAFDGRNAKQRSNEEQQAYIKGAAQWILIHEEGIYEGRENYAERARKNWRRWRESFDSVAANKGCKYEQETAELAGQASAAMLGIKKHSEVSTGDRKALNCCAQ